ncbi:hypothetical protein GCM10009575_087960 [Streptomyces rhizosphaericus]|uniref:Uncharacterized protein n=1 Tax=Streptomyces rhizosphaericus TaxID=114699 RepID=A0ABN1RHI0_9ACTN
MTPPAPRGQDRQHLAEGLVAVEAEGVDQGGQVLAVHDLPEPGVGHGRCGGLGGGGVGAVREGVGGPVALPLEGVGGQLDAAGAGARVVRGPVHGQAADVGPGERVAQGAGLGAAGAQGGQEGVRAVLAAAHALLGHGGEHPVGAELQISGHAVVLEAADAVEEADGLADVADPELGRGDLVGAHQGAGEVGDDRDLRSLVGQPLGHLTEVLQHPVHVRGVEGVADGEPLGLAAPCLEARRDLHGRVLVTGDDDRRRAVDGGDGHPLGEQRCHLVLRRLHGDHRAAGGELLHQLAARGHQGGGVGEREHPGDMGGGELADGVAGEEVGPQPQGLDEAEEGDLDGEQRGLGVAGPVERGGVVAEQHVLQRPVEEAVELGADRVQRLGEHRVRRVQLTAHAEPLAALPGEEERDLALGGEALGHLGVVAAFGERVEAREELLVVGGDDRGTAVEGGAGGGLGVADVDEAVAGVGGQMGPQPERLGAQCLLVLAGQYDRDEGRLGPLRLVALGGLDGGRGGRGLLEDGVHIGAAHAERRDARAARGGALGVLGPLAGGGEQFDVPGRPVDVRGGLGEMEGLGQHTVPHRHDHLDDAADTGARLGVADVGLDGADEQRFALGPVLAVRGEQGLRLDRVAECGAGAMRLDGVHLVGAEPGVGQRLEDDALLRGAVGRGEAVAGAVLVDGGAADHGEHRVALALGVRQPLDEQHADALAQAEAVGLRGEGLGAAVEGQSAHLAVVDEDAGRAHQGGATGEGERAFAVAQRLDGEVERHQRGGARGVDRDGRALETEGVGEAAGGDARGVTGAEVALEVLVGTEDRAQVIVIAGADEDADLPAAHRDRVDSGAFERLPGGLQQHPLLRIHAERFPGADAEQRRVEIGNAVDESALVHIAGAGVVRIRVVHRVDIPPAVQRELADRVDALADDAPQVLGRLHAPGITAADPHDGDGVVVLRLGLLQAEASLVQIRRYQLEVVPQRLFIRHLRNPITADGIGNAPQILNGSR